MDNNEAKQLLAAYRANGADAADPLFREALLQAERDPELAQHLSAQRAFDRRMNEALRSVSPPPEGALHVRTGILFAPKRARFGWWAAGLAAALALLLTTSVVSPRRPLVLPVESSVQALAAHLYEHEMTLGLRSRNFERLTTWLSSKGGPVPGELPPALAALSSIGCQTWETNRGRVSLICFTGDDRKTVHLYIFEDADGFGELPAAVNTALTSEGGWTRAAWRDRERAYVLSLLGEADARATLERLLKV